MRNKFVKKKLHYINQLSTCENESVASSSFLGGIEEIRSIFVCFPDKGINKFIRDEQPKKIQQLTVLPHVNIIIFFSPRNSGQFTSRFPLTHVSTNGIVPSTFSKFSGSNPKNSSSESSIKNIPVFWIYLIKNSVSIDHVLNNIHFVYPSNHVHQSFISMNIFIQ